MVEPLVEANEPQRLARIERPFGDLLHQRDIFKHGKAGDQLAEPKDEADMLTPIARQLGLEGADKIVGRRPDMTSPWSLLKFAL